jgi:pantoate--beta-alanine ligase
MGFLHEGHLSLIDLARAHTDEVVVSLFVNPIQFGPNEDLAGYPRDVERDERLCRARGASALFVPEVGDMYLPGRSVFIDEELLSRGLCGSARPGHFRGVLTVVAKLFNICLPDVAVFGEKDAQQLRVISRMVRDLDIPVEIVPGPIVREQDGLAMSSRNKYLTAEERLQAPIIQQALRSVAASFHAGQRDASLLVAQARACIAQASLSRIDYLELVDDETLQPVSVVEAPALLAAAVWFGRARLLDNVRLSAPGAG